MLECEADGTFRRWPKNGEGIVSGSGVLPSPEKVKLRADSVGGSWSSSVLKERSMVEISRERFHLLLPMPRP